MTRHLFTQNYYVLWRNSLVQRYVTCHFSPKDKNKYAMTNTERGKIFPLKGTKRHTGVTIKNNVLYPCSVLHQMRATMNMAYQRCFRQYLPGCTSQLFYFILFIFAPKLLFQISRQAFFFSYSRISPCSSIEYKCLVFATSYFLLLPCF